MTGISERLERYLSDNEFDRPTLVVDCRRVGENFDRIREAFPDAEVYYAVKCNSAPEVLGPLLERGAKFDAASPREIEMCLAAGALPEDIAYGNTIKKRKDIAKAYELGIRLFAFDGSEELEKIADAAPGAKVVCRLLVDNTGAAWPLSGKFGCAPDMARDLLIAARELGLCPFGLSFHVGSQQTMLDAWDYAIERAASIFRELEQEGIQLKILNIGGGFPVEYRDNVPPIDAVGASIAAAVSRAFGNRAPDITLEPGRYITADAGVIRAEVVLVSRKRYDEELRWVYLDVGRFGGLAETEGEAIEYPLRTPGRNGATGPVVLAGPTCDGADILYQHANYELPLELAAGDPVDILNAGAYTSSYATAGFNGFAPVSEVYI